MESFTANRKVLRWIANMQHAAGFHAIPARWRLATPTKAADRAWVLEYARLI